MTNRARTVCKSSKLLYAVALTALFPQSLLAQDGVPLPAPSSGIGNTVAGTPTATGDSAQANSLTDIVVTAQRRSERLQDVPIAVSAVTGEALAANGISGIDTMQVSVPSLSTQNAGGKLALHLRGVGAIVGGAGYENPIALYVDGVYYGNQNIGLLQFNNVDRIEVLKGPQGTLFGRNATGGLVQIITSDPGQRTEARGSLSYGNYNAVEAQLFASGPATSNLAANIAVRFSHHDGWGTNSATGKDVYDQDYDIGVRSKIVWTPEEFKLTLIGDHNSRQNSLALLSLVEGSRLAPASPPASYPDPWDVINNAQPGLKQRSTGVSLKIERPIGEIGVSNLVAYRTSRGQILLDYDGTALPLAAIDENTRDWQFSNEFQLSSGNGGAFTWLAGAFYYRARGGLAPLTITLASDPLFNPSFPVGSIAYAGRQDAESISAFGQGTLALTDRLSGTVGARYTYEKRKVDTRSDAALLLPGNPSVPVDPQTRQETSFKRPTFRVSLDYKFTDDFMAYASLNTGFKSGGYNVSAPTYAFYRPEKIKAYEVGQKADLFGRTVRLNTSAFYYDYTDVQTQLVQSVGNGIINGGKARIYGLDVDLTAFPVRNFQIDGSVSLLSAKYRSFPQAPIGTPGGGVPVTIGDVSGNRMPYSPKIVTNVGATWTVPMGESKIVVHGNWLHSASYYHEADNIVRESSFDKLSASVSYTFYDERLSVSIFGTNLTNEAVGATVLTSPPGQQLTAIQPPRTYGVRFGFAF